MTSHLGGCYVAFLSLESKMRGMMVEAVKDIGNALLRELSIRDRETRERISEELKHVVEEQGQEMKGPVTWFLFYLTPVVSVKLDSMIKECIKDSISSAVGHHGVPTKISIEGKL